MNLWCILYIVEVELSSTSTTGGHEKVINKTKEKAFLCYIFCLVAEL